MSHIRCVYVDNWKPDVEQRGQPCGGPVAPGSKVPLCDVHKDQTCTHCDFPATRKYQGKTLCTKSACG